jgi:RNA-directed DNA polymerase
MFRRELRYIRHTHPKKPTYWTGAKYFGQLNLDRQDRLVFGDKRSGLHLLKFSWFPIEYPCLVKGGASPDDPNLKEYWKKRQASKAKDLTLSKQKIAQRQRGICPVCGQSLFNEEVLHIHHKQLRSKGGKSSYSNLVLVHLYCHQKIHSNSDEKSENNGKRSSCVSDELKPDEGKLSSPVLRGGRQW